jgi:hypothetical protein
MYIRGFFDSSDAHRSNQIYFTAKFAEDAERKREMKGNDLNVISIFVFISALSAVKYFADSAEVFCFQVIRRVSSYPWRLRKGHSLRAAVLALTEK